MNSSSHSASNSSLQDSATAVGQATPSPQPPMSPKPQSQWRGWGLRWSKLVAVVALVNLVIVLFDASYLPLRDIYIRYVPAVVQAYDPVKGVEPHPDTQIYLATVDQLEEVEPRSHSTPSSPSTSPASQSTDSINSTGLTEFSETTQSPDLTNSPDLTKTSSVTESTVVLKSAGGIESPRTTETAPPQPPDHQPNNQLDHQPDNQSDNQSDNQPNNQQDEARSRFDPEFLILHVFRQDEDPELPTPGIDLANATVPELLASLRQQSIELIEENPFIVSNKFGTYAKLKQRIQGHVGATTAKQAFVTFWDEAYLDQNGWAAELSFFDQRIRPLMATNYFRALDEFGQFVDLFWRIDLIFILFFAADYLGRTFLASRRHAEVSWGDALLRRWYDGFLFLPHWRWLRIISVTVRLHQSRLVNMERALAQVTHEPASYLSDRVSKFLMVRLINQAQLSIQKGNAAQFLFEPKNYVQVSDINKVDAIADRLIQLSIYRVLPEVQPELEELLHHSLSEVIKRSDFYDTVRQLPGIGNLPSDAIEQLSEYLAQGTYDVLANVYADQEGRVLMEQLSQDFRRALKEQLQDDRTQQELQTLLSDLLEELKINYIQRSADESPEDTMDEVEQLHRAMQDTTALPPADSDTPTAEEMNAKLRSEV